MKQALFFALCTLPLGLAHAGRTLHVDVPEPSGIDTDRSTGRIFVVDDGGELWIFDEDLSVISVFDVGGDLEGVQYLPHSGLLLLAVEGDEQLLLVSPETGERIETLDIPRTFQGRTVLAEGGNGIETLTVVGSRIFVANQSFDLTDKEDGSVLIELAMMPGGGLVMVDAHPLPVLDVAGSLYDAPTRSLFLLSDTDDQVYQLTLQSLDQLPAGAPISESMLDSFWVPGEDQEGICLIDGRLLIAQDSGDLYEARLIR